MKVFVLHSFLKLRKRTAGVKVYSFQSLFLFSHKQYVHEVLYENISTQTVYLRTVFDGEYQCIHMTFFFVYSSYSKGTAYGSFLYRQNVTFTKSCMQNFLRQRSVPVLFCLEGSFQGAVTFERKSNARRH